MALPFTTEQFFEIFTKYNNSTWLSIFAFYFLAIVSLFLIIKKTKNADKITSGFLTILWLWMGIVYHILFFSSINKAALAFGTIFIIQGLLFFVFGVLKDKINYSIKKDVYSVIGLFFIVFGLVIYPLIGSLAGHIYPAAPFFGAPCPTTIFTFGLLLLTQRRFSKYLLIIPALWSVIGFSAAILLNVPQDYFLLIAGIISIALIIHRDRKS